MDERWKNALYVSVTLTVVLMVLAVLGVLNTIVIGAVTLIVDAAVVFLAREKPEAPRRVIQGNPPETWEIEHGGEVYQARLIDTGPPLSSVYNLLNAQKRFRESWLEPELCKIVRFPNKLALYCYPGRDR